MKSKQFLHLYLFTFSLTLILVKFPHGFNPHECTIGHQLVSCELCEMGWHGRSARAGERVPVLTVDGCAAGWWWSRPGGSTAAPTGTAATATTSATAAGRDTSECRYVVGCRWSGRAVCRGARTAGAAGTCRRRAARRAGNRLYCAHGHDTLPHTWA